MKETIISDIINLVTQYVTNSGDKNKLIDGVIKLSKDLEKTQFVDRLVKAYEDYEKR